MQTERDDLLIIERPIEEIQKEDSEVENFWASLRGA